MTNFIVLKVAKTIDKLKMKKAPGYDKLTPLMFRELSKKAFVFLTKVHQCLCASSMEKDQNDSPIQTR